MPQLLETLKGVSYPDVRIVLRDMYMHHSGIFPILDKTVTAGRPFASVELHEAEDIIDTSRLNASINSFIGKDIAKHTNLSLMDYLRLPHDYIIMINNAIAIKRRQMEDAGNSLVNDLDSMGKG